MLPGEKRADYNALSAAIFDEWAPDGVTEQCLVAHYVAFRSRKRRMVQYDQIRLQQQSIRPAKRTKLIVIRHPYGPNGRSSAEPSDGLENANAIVQLQQLARPQL
jgi:hypothetical protein